MKRFFCTLFFVFCLVSSYAQMPALERVEPMFWWTGMVNPKLQLLVHGDKIAGYSVSLHYDGVALEKVNRVENPNYLFLDLLVDKNARPGRFDIVFSQKGKKNLHYTYELKQQVQSPDRNQGVTDKDFIYLIMPDRFANGDPSNDKVAGMKDQSLNRDSMYYRHGGDLQGIIDHLDYIKDLGATAIWLTPEIENDMSHASYHGYAATDLYKIDPRYGTNELYKTYAEKCHALGLKVIKDIVHNHIGSESWLMQDLPMKDWVHQWPEYTNTNYRDQPLMDIHASAKDRKLQLDGWFVPTMPDVNEDNPYVQNYYIQNHIWWIEYAGIDGLRLDTYPYNNPQFMARWAIALKAQFPRLSIFGETMVKTVAEQAFYTEGNTVNRGFDTHLPGVTDYALNGAIYEALNGKFGWDDGVSRVYETLAQDFLYKDPTKNCIFLDDHDVSRFYSVIGEDFDKYKQGVGMLLTMRGVPEIYYGTEILMKNFSNPDGLVREDFKGGWANDPVNKFTEQGRTEKENEAFNYVRTLANFRKTSSALQTGKLMQYVPEDGIYVYFRYDYKQTVMIIVNSNDTLKTLQTQRFDERLKGFARATNVITQESLPALQSIDLPKHSIIILELKK